VVVWWLLFRGKTLLRAETNDGKVDIKGPGLTWTIVEFDYTC
jgi:hypothetical protein